MDRDTRSAIERATQRARKLLEEDFAAQLEGDFDVHRNGSVAVQPGPHLSSRQAFQRDRIAAALEHKRAAGLTAADAVADYLRDTAFTTLNRFVALKMLEARELVQECVTKGEQSVGYREFSGMAPGLPLLPESAGYRLYIESLFDELSTEVKVLFDRRDPASALWPRRATFEALLEILNAGELSAVWGEDETIGWVYQYFNGGEERRRMREESQAPRNSRELAVRNQFFTPRYVVQFLTDNTLGRIWYEMRGAKTVLVERCEYLMRKPDESFPPRARKDPRDIRVLDPACGSGHFLLYAFDQLLAIYEEAHADPEGPRSEATGRTLAEDYESVDELRREIPGLILKHNLYGVDIDARCAQIAQLALWMRAQRAYREFEIARGERIRIRRSNIVVAEPLVADEQVAHDFVTRLGDVELERAFMRLIGALKRAGELGLLLRVEALLGQEIRKNEMGNIFAPPAERIREALGLFVAEEHDRANLRKRLFAEDAVQGIGLLLIAEKKYDVVLMNPPFGDATSHGTSHLKQYYADAANDLFAAFVARGIELLSKDGVVGAITSRTGFFATSLKDWRRRVYEGGLYLVADLGEGVMDAAMVEAAAYCVGRSSQTVVFRHLLDANKASALCATVESTRVGLPDNRTFELRIDTLKLLPDAPLVYWVPPAILQKLARLQSFEPAKGAVRKGLRTGDNFRFVRAHWEVCVDRIETGATRHDTGSGWVPLVMTGASQPWFSPIYLLLNWHEAGRELRASVLRYGTESRLIQAKDYYFRAGFSWTRRAVRLFPYAIPPGCIFTGSRPMAFPASSAESSAVVALFASRIVSAFLRFYGEQFARPNFLEGKLKLTPIPALDGNAVDCLREAFRHGSSTARKEYQYFEPFLEFVAPRLELHEANKGGLTFDRRSLLSEQAEEDVRRIFDLSPNESESVERDLREALELAATGVAWGEDRHEVADEEGEDAVVLVDSLLERGWRILSYAIGCLFGRWNLEIRANAGHIERSSDERLSAVPDGYLRKAEVGEDYPIRVIWDGIAEDDPGSNRDLISGIERCLHVIAVDPASVLRAIDATEGDLRAEVRETLFRWHVRTYTLGRRKAPIYWQLATPSASYSVWLYLHAFTRDTLFRVQNDYVAPKLAHEERRLESIRRDAGESGAAAARRAVVAQEAFVEELRAFLEDVKRVAPFWNPNLDDGVIINFAPLWRLVPQHKSWQRELKTSWDALCAGEYDWAHLAMHLWPERVVPKCATDRSLAIAHGLEKVFWAEGLDGKWAVCESPTPPMEELICERTSPAVKAALKSLLEAPIAVAVSRSQQR